MFEAFADNSRSFSNPLKVTVRGMRRLLRARRNTDRTNRSFNKSHYTQIGRFLEEHGINPCPQNYNLAYRFCIEKEPSLDAYVSELIETGYAQRPDDNLHQYDAFENDLAEVTLQTQMQLASIEKVVIRTQADASDYGMALEGASGKLVEPATSHVEAVRALCALTRTMISKTQEVKSELRTRSDAISGLMASLHDARKRADTDALTGLSNRRAFERQLGAAVERSRQTGVACTLAICDIDHFKLINDQFGHETGDRVIKLVAENFEQYCSIKGDVFRFGGEEYVILFTGLTGPHVIECIENARVSLENRALVHRESGTALDRVTFSAGIASLEACDDPSALLRKADRALYQAKSQGRNCIRVL